MNCVLIVFSFFPSILKLITDECHVPEDSLCVNPQALVTETVHQHTIIFKESKKLELSPTDIKGIRNRNKRTQRKIRRQNIRAKMDFRTKRTKEQILDRKLKSSIDLQKRAIRGYWKHGVGKAKDASIADTNLLASTRKTTDKTDILFGSKCSFERQRMREQMDYSFKRANFAVKLLQECDIIRDTNKDVRLIERKDIERIVLEKTIIKK